MILKLLEYWLGLISSRNPQPNFRMDATWAWFEYYLQQGNHEVLAELQQPVSELELVLNLQNQKVYNQKNKEILRNFEQLQWMRGVWMHENDP